ncbi:MAG TPA: PadR family transcriptional regulator [Anaerolineales bacterium]|nr:PadR family transcriptional regulator [Anaerolineales bacterium]
MPLAHAILGFLDYSPMSGYDLKKFFDQSIVHFWSATQSHIYKALEKLEEDGFVSAEIILQDGKPNRKQYQLTPAGREELHRWVVTPLPLSPTREAWLIQIFFSHASSNAEVIALLQNRAEQIKANLAAFQQEKTTHPSTERASLPGVERKSRLWKLTGEYGAAYYQAELVWLEDAIRKIQEFPD